MTVAAAGFLVMLPAASAHASDPEPFVMENINSRLCLEIGGWSSANGGTADQWNCIYPGDNPDANQAWRFEPVNGYYRIVNAFSGKCLEVQGWSQSNGATVDQWDCLSNSNGPDTNQLWFVGGGRVINVNSNKCLEVQGWSQSNGGRVDQWDCLSNSSGSDPNQQWTLIGPYDM
ncbi:RICIN domain-containing protein [Streptacidiphilus melanogenes]|uniref:RICIN domain-containing protein n=1 Tax=Streptacidiphilus melanogenes TaxID=411235 RepID=UPI000694B615|nr:RICIN domain-containing protein [Streptacidiphilus melanogenes]